MTRRLSDLVPDEVSLVDRAAIRRRFLVLKNEGGDGAMEDGVWGVTPDLLDELSIPVDGEDAIVTKAAGELGNGLRGAAKTILRLLTAHPELKGFVRKLLDEGTEAGAGPVRKAADGTDLEAFHKAASTMSVRDLAWSQIEKAAGEQQRRNPALSAEQAVTRALKHDPEARQAYELYRSADAGESVADYFAKAAGDKTRGFSWSEKVDQLAKGYVAAGMADTYAAAVSLVAKSAPDVVEAYQEEVARGRI